MVAREHWFDLVTAVGLVMHLGAPLGDLSQRTSGDRASGGTHFTAPISA
jgi:hypothetical protein